MRGCAFATMAALPANDPHFGIGLAWYVFSKAPVGNFVQRMIARVSPRVHCGVVFFVDGKLLPWDFGAWAGRDTGGSPLGTASVQEGHMGIQMQDVCVWRVNREVFCTVYRQLCVCTANPSGCAGSHAMLPRAKLPYPPVNSMIQAHILKQLHLSCAVQTQEPALQCAQYCLCVFRYLLFACPSVFDQSLDAYFEKLAEWQHGLSPQQLYDAIVKRGVSHRVFSADDVMSVLITSWNSQDVLVKNVCIPTPHSVTLSPDVENLLPTVADTSPACVHFY